MWGLGIAGQLCWNIENQWFNTFVYAKIAKDSTIVTWMVIVSALVTTFSTFLFGTWSDRAGSRRRFVSIGYIAWGVLTIAFGLTQYLASGTVGDGAKVSILVAALVVLADAVMSFFGSMGNDSGYNAWSNDMTSDANRGQVGAVLATVPVIGTIAGTILGGLLIGADDNYQRLFWTMGLIVIAVGVVSLFTLRDSDRLRPRRDGTFWHQFASVFHLKGFFAQRELALACLTTALFFIPFNVYFVHMGNWIIYRMGFGPDSMGLIQGLGLLLASVLVIPAGILINRHRVPLVATIAVGLNIAGLVLITVGVRPGTVDPTTVFSLKNLPLFVAVFLAGAGYILVIQSMTMWVKQLYPQDSRGQFEGVRILFFTLIPMIIGTAIGNIIVTRGAGTIVNAQGITENIPTESIFFWAAILAVWTFIPLRVTAVLYRRRVASHQEKESQ
jgi:MFS family permease